MFARQDCTGRISREDLVQEQSICMEGREMLEVVFSRNLLISHEELKDDEEGKYDLNYKARMSDTEYKQ